MTVYVFGAGASKHVGYPLGSSMGKDLICWMRTQTNSIQQYPVIAEQIDEMFGHVDDVDGLFERMEEIVREFENGTPEQKVTRSIVANSLRPAITEAARDLFFEIRREGKDSVYASFARDIVQSGDCVLTFNYDVSLDRRLQEFGRWHLGDGYGFEVDGFPMDSPTKLLKLHGSTNWLALMDGLPLHGAAQVSSVFKSTRAALGTRELDFLGYPGRKDSIFPGGQPALPAMITGRNKKFCFDTSFGPEWHDFWQELWGQAAANLARAARVVICGYSLPAVDGAACALLFSAPPKTAEILVLSGETRSREIVGEYGKRGFSNAKVAPNPYFEKWVKSTAGGQYL